MKKALTVILLLLSCGTKTPPGKTWHVSDGFVRDPSGRAVTLRGIQMSGAQKSPPYLDANTIADYRRIHDDWGFNSIRFLMVWAAVEPEKGVYDEKYLDGLAERIGWAQQVGLSVILDMHQDIYGEGFGFDGAPRWACDASHYAAFTPTSPWSLNAINPDVSACTDELYTRPETVEHFTEAWRRVAHRLKDSPAIIGFDLLNEPEWGTADPTTFERERLQPFYEHVVPVIRSEASHWLAFLEPGTNRNLGFASSLQPFPFPDVVYSPHSYDVKAETGGGFPAENRASLLANLTDLSREAKSLGAALWIGEYGGIADDPSIGDYMGAQYDGIGAVAGGSNYWDYGHGGYSPLAPDGSERTALLEAIARPYPDRTAGDPQSYGFDAATKTFTFTYKPNRNLTDPTELIVPARVYPNGFVVDCGDCTARQDGARVFITKPASGETTNVRISPRS